MANTNNGSGGSGEHFDRIEHNRNAGRLGGQVRSEAKLASGRANTAKMRQMKAYYRAHPDQRPSRQREEEKP